MLRASDAETMVANLQSVDGLREDIVRMGGEGQRSAVLVGTRYATRDMRRGRGRGGGDECDYGVFEVRTGIESTNSELRAAQTLLRAVVTRGTMRGGGIADFEI
jgi:hypothetical protein